MIDKKYWKDELKGLSYDELSEIEKIINELKKKASSKEEFIEVLRRWQKKYPTVKYFCTGNSWKGAWECEGEFGVEDWQESYDCCERIYNNYEVNDKDTKNFVKKFKSLEEFEETCLNNFIDNDKQFEKDVNNSLHAPKWDSGDAEYNNNGETIYEFIDIKTGKTFELITSAY